MKMIAGAVVLVAAAICGHAAFLNHDSAIMAVPALVLGFAGFFLFCLAWQEDRNQEKSGS